MNCHRFLCILFFVFDYLCKTLAVIDVTEEKNCSIYELRSCTERETCKQRETNSSQGTCVCYKDYSRSKSGLCVSNLSDPSQDFSNSVSASAIAVGLLVPVISIIIIGGLVVAARRYRWVHRFRDEAQQLTVRSYDTVLVGNEEDIAAG